MIFIHFSWFVFCVGVCNSCLWAVYCDQIISWWCSNLCQRLIQPYTLSLIVMYPMNYSWPIWLCPQSSTRFFVWSYADDPNLTISNVPAPTGVICPPGRQLVPAVHLLHWLSYRGLLCPTPILLTTSELLWRLFHIAPQRLLCCHLSQPRPSLPDPPL